MKHLLCLSSYTRCVWDTGALRTTSQCLPHQTRCHCFRRVQHPDSGAGRRLAGLCDYFNPISLVTVCFLTRLPVSEARAGRRRGRHLYHQLQCAGDGETLHHCRVSGRTRPDPGPAFDLHAHRSAGHPDLHVFLH